jgi:hypothetical protein
MDVLEKYEQSLFHIRTGNAECMREIGIRRVNNILKFG